AREDLGSEGDDLDGRRRGRGRGGGRAAGEGGGGVRRGVWRGGRNAVAAGSAPATRAVAPGLLELRAYRLREFLEHLVRDVLHEAGPHLGEEAGDVHVGDHAPLGLAG